MSDFTNNLALYSNVTETATKTINTAKIIGPWSGGCGLPTCQVTFCVLLYYTEGHMVLLLRCGSGSSL